MIHHGLAISCLLLWALAIVRFLKSLKNLKTLKITTFRRMDVHSSSGGGGETPILLYPVDRADLWIGKPSCRREDNIKTDPNDTECEGVDWILMA
jgi:hypothetical protein